MSQLCPQHLRREWKFYLRFTSLDSTIMTFVQSANTHWMVGLMFDWFVGIYLVDLLHKYNNKFYAWLNPIQSNCRECSKVQFCHIFLKKGPFPASFSFIFVFSIQLTVNVQYFLLMTGFEPRTSGIGSDSSANCVTTTAPLSYSLSIESLTE